MLRKVVHAFFAIVMFAGVIAMAAKGDASKYGPLMIGFGFFGFVATYTDDDDWSI